MNAQIDRINGKAEQAEARDITPRPSRFNVLSRQQLDELPEPTWLVDNVVPSEGVGLIIGQSTAGKTFVALDLIAHVLLGRAWFDHQVTPSRALYIGLEGGPSRIRKRIEAFENLHDVRIPVESIFDSVNVADDDTLADLCNVATDYDLVVVDTLAQAAAGCDENSAQDMSTVINALQRMQRASGGVILAVHHLGKDTTRGARGHSSLYAACDCVLAVTQNGQMRTVSNDPQDGGKLKDGEPASHTFTVASYADSAVIFPADGQAPDTPKLTPNERMALDTFDAAVSDGEAEDGGWLHLDAWREYYYERSTADTKDSKAKAFKRSRDSLSNYGYINVSNDYYSR
ncbi:AAA family ATPase [Salinisphaera orenii]|uniref:AAA family ATPase n=1 Tax=Salinisphaera orenii TaxID=856731 RepID=UPI000DBE4E02